LEIDNGGWRGRIVGVTRIGGKAVFVAAFVLALLTGLILYGITTAGHHHASRVTDGAPLTKASEQHEAWWESVPDAPSSPIPLPPETAVRVPRTPPRAVREESVMGEESSMQQRVPEVAPMPFTASVRAPQPSEHERVEEHRHALLDAAVAAPVSVNLDDVSGAAGGVGQHSFSDAASAPMIPASMLGAPSGSSSASSSSDTSGQDERLAYLSQERTATVSHDRLPAERREAGSPFVLRAGSLIPATLLTGINADLPGTLLAQVHEDVFDSVTGRYLLIPNGARLTGTYDSHVVQGQSRVLAVWKRLLYPDGSSLDLLGMQGVDPAGYAGFGAAVDAHLAKTLHSALLLSVINAGAQLSQPQRSETLGGAPDLGQTIAGAIGQQLASGSMQLTQRQMQVPPTLSVAPGYRFNVLVDRDIVLSEPYGDGSAAP
jgi:type IV secretion system protein VirB10